MLKFSYLFLFFITTIKIFADADYHYSVDLTKASNDKLTVTLTPPDINENEIVFMFPAMVPGTYDVYDFGRFVSNFKVKGKNGIIINIQLLDKNSYKLSPANLIEQISYDVEDTYDTNIKEKIVFEPGGTNIEEGKLFSLNTHGFFGYFKNYIQTNFILEFTKPEGFYPSTSIANIKLGTTKDVISIYNYHDLVDSPILYCQPDTTVINIGKSKILVSVYSVNKQITSAFIAQNLQQLLNAQANYLGGELPIDKYAFLFYFTDKPTLSGSNGALEHSYSSFYVLTEGDTTLLGQEIKDIASHEFFHIVTPLNIHSKEIGEFDFNNPVMSKHLWLYEGLTEYAAHHMQAKTGLTQIETFFDKMIGKMRTARENYNDTVPFTVMSKYVLDKYKKEYNNVYEKGALIGMCLDVMLRYYSNGKYGTQNLMIDLSKKYGKTYSFNDDDLFDDIEKLSYKEIRYFLNNYVAGNKPLPFKDVFAMVGLIYNEKTTSQQVTLGGINIVVNDETNRLIVVKLDNLDAFGKKLKFKQGDEIITFNNRKLMKENAQEVLGQFIDNAKKGDKLVVDVMRKDKQGNQTIKTLKAKVKPVLVTEYDSIELNQSATEQQLTARKAWLGLD